MNITLLILSCDAYEDTWDIFFDLKDKYWSCCPYETYLMTETKDYDRCKVIKATGVWTERLRNTLEQLESDYVLIMLDDFFIRDYVDQERINDIKFNDNVAVYNFEKAYDLPFINIDNGFKLRKNKTHYLNSCQPSLHNRTKLIERLKEDQNPWEWELTLVNSQYEFYVNDKELIIDIGYYDHKPWSIKNGKWCREVIPFFEKEGIIIDYKQRGFWD